MSERLRILVVPKWYPWPEDPMRGPFCREHARALATRHDVVVLPSFAMPRPGFLAYRLEDRLEEGLRTLRLRYRRPFLRPPAMGFQLAGMLAALRRLRREGWVPDVVHAHVYQAGLPALALGRRAGAPVVITEHYTGFERGLVTGYDRLIARTAFQSADLVAPVSSYLARYVTEIAPKARVRVLPNVVDTGVFRPPAQLREPGEGLRLLTVGALADKKGQSYLIEAMARLDPARNATLDIVGGGPLRAELEALAARLGLADRVRLRGELPKEQVAQLMRESDVFVLPSIYETFGCVLIEAMASGLPVVATAVGGVPEVVLDGEGRLVEPRDPDALAQAIEATLTQETMERRAAQAERTAERYGYPAFAQVWTEAYATLPRGRS
jgi:glycosyltransferase involved in cell wall biosynthesis